MVVHSFGRRAQREGVARAYGHVVRRLLGLALLAVVIYAVPSVARSWQELVELGPAGALRGALKDWFQTLLHIAVTSLWILPVIRARPAVRVVFALASAALFFVLSHWFYFDWVQTGGIDGGVLGFLAWTIPTIVGTLACDAVLNAALLDAAVRTMNDELDPRHGGFGRAPKFPHATSLELLLRHAHASERAGSDSTVLTSLTTPVASIDTNNSARPEPPADLAQHRAIIQARADEPQMTRWEFTRGKERAVVTVPVRMIVRDGIGLVDAAAGGGGVIRPFEIAARRMVAADTLRVLMPEWTMPPAAINAAFPKSRHMPAKVRVFLEFARSVLGA